MNEILQGTTPSLTITIPEEIAVSSITAAELAFRHSGTTTLYHLSDLTVDSEANTLTYPFTEAETLALSPTAPLTWQLRIQTADGIFGTAQQRINVLDLISDEAIS